MSTDIPVKVYKNGGPSCAKKRKNHRKKFVKIDNFTKDLIRRIIYEFHDKRIAPTLDEIFYELRKRTFGTNYEFTYSRTISWRIIKSLGFRDRKLGKRAVIMESMRLVAMRYNFLTNI